MKKCKNEDRCCETCDNLIAIGEGDHICYEVKQKNGEPCIMPIQNYQPSEEYYLCGGAKWKH